MIMYLAINMITIIETMVMIAMRSLRENVIKRLKLSINFSFRSQKTEAGIQNILSPVS